MNLFLVLGLETTMQNFIKLSQRICMHRGTADRRTDKGR